MLGFTILNEDTRETLHVFVLLVSLLLVAVNFFTKQNVPVLPKLVLFLLLLVNKALYVDRVLALTLITVLLVLFHWETTDAVVLDVTTPGSNGRHVSLVCHLLEVVVTFDHLVDIDYILHLLVFLLLLVFWLLGGL